MHASCRVLVSTLNSILGVEKSLQVIRSCVALSVPQMDFWPVLCHQLGNCLVHFACAIAMNHADCHFKFREYLLLEEVKVKSLWIVFKRAHMIPSQFLQCSLLNLLERCLYFKHVVRSRHNTCLSWCTSLAMYHSGVIGVQLRSVLTTI